MVIREVFVLQDKFLLSGKEKSKQIELARIYFVLSELQIWEAHRQEICDIKYYAVNKMKNVLRLIAAR